MHRSGCRSKFTLIYLLAAELIPALALKLHVKLVEMLSGKEVDEAVSNVALVFDVARQVQEVVGIGKVLVDFLA